ncbi:unnamed protein product [Rotaria magnacalcarata]|uniref:thioredoxin-dependent peroxiredoxin n=1 Tax=Rotaria magnacalcarata TaxID=392030 RepID=A0A816ZH36_9BILA|nr:unnamed protein product [Rotaria magnacalcarata]CAF3789307.1 unnamed protein product [Rotaria magnacalcarata]
MSLPRIGKPAPEFTAKAIVNNKLTEVSLRDYNQKYVILLFFPMNFSYICPTELIAFNDHSKDFEKINAYTVACSIESHYSYLKCLSVPPRQGGVHGITVPLVVDKNMEISKKYGILDEAHGIPYRAMFIIDDSGSLRQITINDYSIGRNVLETQRLVEAIQESNKLHKNSTKSDFLEVSMPSSPPKRCTTLTWAERSFRHQITE